MTDQVSLAGLSRDADVQDVTPPDPVSSADNAWNQSAPGLKIGSRSARSTQAGPTR